jgi:hypothetical protein
MHKYGGHCGMTPYIQGMCKSVQKRIAMIQNICKMC